MPNIGLMREVLDAIRKAPNAHGDKPVPEGEIGWDQTDWRRPENYGCGTAYCYAGWVAELDPDARWGSGLDVVQFGDGEKKFVWDYAASRLGLTDNQADRLFSGGNTLDDLESIIGQIEAEPDWDPYDEDEDEE